MSTVSRKQKNKLYGQFRFHALAMVPTFSMVVIFMVSFIEGKRIGCSIKTYFMIGLFSVSYLLLLLPFCKTCCIKMVCSQCSLYVVFLLMCARRGLLTFVLSLLMPLELYSLTVKCDQRVILETILIGCVAFESILFIIDTWRLLQTMRKLSISLADLMENTSTLDEATIQATRDRFELIIDPSGNDKLLVNAVENPEDSVDD
eukprot:229346_1